MNSQISRAKAGPAPARTSAAAQVAKAIHQSTIDFVCGVPDYVLSEMTDYLSRVANVHYMPREDVAVAAAVGAFLNGRRPLVFMKNAGFGNALDACISLAACSAIPLPIVVGWAGSGSDRLPHHLVWGQRTEATAGLISATFLAVDDDSADIIDSASQFFDESFSAREIRCLLVGSP